jgi:hypothetical protein
MTDRHLAFINHYARAGLHKHVQSACNEGLAGAPGNPVLLLWRAYGLAMEGASAEVNSARSSSSSRRRRLQRLPATPPFTRKRPRRRR